MNKFALFSFCLGFLLVFATVSVQAQTGNVGIGTTSPIAKLHVVPANGAAVAISPFGIIPGSTGEVRYYEITTNGSNYVGMKAPDAIAGNVIWILPATDGTSGQVLSTNGSGALNWVTPSGGGGGGGANGHCYTCDGF